MSRLMQLFFKFFSFWNIILVKFLKMWSFGQDLIVQVIFLLVSTFQNSSTFNTIILKVSLIESISVRRLFVCIIRRLISYSPVQLISASNISFQWYVGLYHQWPSVHSILNNVQKRLMLYPIKSLLVIDESHINIFMLVVAFLWSTSSQKLPYVYPAHF